MGGGGAASGQSSLGALKGTEGTCVAREAGPSPGREEALPARPAPNPPRQREALCPSGL